MFSVAEQVSRDEISREALSGVIDPLVHCCRAERGRSSTLFAPVKADPLGREHCRWLKGNE
jgi:hypothetical protein